MTLGMLDAAAMSRFDAICINAFRAWFAKARLEGAEAHDF